jgi:internalin A
MALKDLLGRFANAGLVRCYISFSRQDGYVYTRNLAELLSARGLHVTYTDRFDPRGWVSTIREAVQSANVFILVGTPAALTSESVGFALGYAITRNLQIFAITFEGVVVDLLGSDDLNSLVWNVEPASALAVGPSDSIVQEFKRSLTQVPPALTLLRRAKSPQGRTDNMRPLNEGKLILVGRGEVGKTSLVRRLVENDFRGDESKTQGINITSWPIDCAGETLRLNMWDFGGQEIMHATHQFFLTERSLYLLVLNGREGGEDLDAEYWLKHIESFGGDSPVIVVQNKIGQHSFDLNYRGLQGRYPQIRGFVKTDCRDGTGLAELRAAIQDAVGRMPEVRMTFPSDWFAVKERLESMDDEYIGYDAFRRLCAEEGVADDSDRDTLSFVLHCLGIALHYRDDARLRETNVLKPEWVTQGIYSILNASQLAKRQGELGLTDLQKLLPRKRYPTEKHLFLLELMRKFSLCFAFPDDPDRYLVPDLLGKEEPEQTRDFVPAECLNFEYHYGVLPEGLIPRFIVRSHSLSRGQERWRFGVILAHEGCRALVTAIPAERRVIVRVQGGNATTRRNLLAIIRYDFDRIHAEFKNRLEVQAKVPLAAHPSFTVEYDELTTFERKDVKDFPKVIGQDVVMVNVTELLNGIDLEEQRRSSTRRLILPTSVFFSYAHEDEPLRDQLETRLKLLQRRGVISTWHDRKILAGMEWDDEIDVHLRRANIILLLISDDFLASDYAQKEMLLAMERHHAGEATVVPIMLRPCDWKGEPFENLQGLPEDMTPVTTFSDRDIAWAEVAAGIRAIAERK